MSKKQGTAISVFLVLALAAGGVAWWWQRSEEPQPGQCAVCTRAVHAGMSTLYTDDGKPREACCPACAFEFRRESGHRVEITQVSDYKTGQGLAPEEATYVVGSDEHPCAHAEVVAPETGQRLPIHYDRCLPSVLAFHDAASAQSFASEHGGEVMGWAGALAKLREKKL